MSKKKNGTTHNQSRKAHRNGIHQLPKHMKKSCKGMYVKYLANLRESRKWAKVPGGRLGLKSKPQVNASSDVSTPAVQQS